MQKEIRRDEASNSFLNLAGLTATLEAAGIDHKLWGVTSGSKPVEKLLKELQTGDSRLVHDNEGRLIREVEQVGVFVFAGDMNGNFFILKEDKQVLADGRVKKRGMEGVSFREKLNITKEGFNTAFERGLAEELPEIYAKVSKGLWTDLNNYPIRVDSYRPPVILQEAGDYKPSFPGLPNRSMEYRYTFFIPTSAFKPEGYQTKEKDKTTFFVWERVSADHPRLPVTVWQKLGNNSQKQLAEISSNNPKRPTEIPPTVFAEYTLLKVRGKSSKSDQILDYGSKAEIESTVTAFRIFYLEKMFPSLKRIH